MQAPLTDREWWLVQHTYSITLEALRRTSDRLHRSPPQDIARALLKEPYAARLRAATEKLLEKYADPS